MLSIANLKSKFVFDQVSPSLNCIENTSGNVKAVTCDGIKTNQTFFKISYIVLQKPCLKDQGAHLFHDYGHISKYIYIIESLDQELNLYLAVKMYQKGAIII